MPRLISSGHIFGDAFFTHARSIGNHITRVSLILPLHLAIRQPK